MPYPPDDAGLDAQADFLIEAYAHVGTRSEGSRPWHLTPQMAWRLIHASEITADSAIGDPEYLQDMLPARFAKLLSGTWIERWRQSFNDLGDRLKNPAEADRYLARCVGEEAALDAMIEFAEAWHLDMEPEMEEYHAALRRMASAGDPQWELMDTGFGLYRCLLFKDRDFEMLWDPAMTGIEADDDLARHMGFRNLHYSRWFIPFDD